MYVLLFLVLELRKLGKYVNCRLFLLLNSGVNLDSEFGLVFHALKLRGLENSCYA